MAKDLNKKSKKEEKVTNADTTRKSKKETKSSKTTGDNKNKKSGFKDFKAELKKVVWPTPKELLNSTTAVIVIVLVTAIIVFALDVLFESLNNNVIDRIRTSVSESINSDEESNTDNNEVIVDSSEENDSTDTNNSETDTTVDATTDTTNADNSGAEVETTTEE